MAFKPTKQSTPFAPTKQAVNQEDETALNVASFFSSNELTPLLWYNDGKNFGIITSNLESGTGSPKNKNGLDIWAPNGTPIPIFVNGTVESVFTDGSPRDKSNEGFGNQVVIVDEKGDKWQYSHMKEGSIKLKEGDKVTKFQEIGQIGNTGDVMGATGNHTDIMWFVDGKDQGINATQKELEGKLPTTVMKDFNSKQFDNVSGYLSVIADIDSQMAQDLTPSILSIAGNKLKEQWGSIKEAIPKLPEMALGFTKKALMEQHGPLKIAWSVLSILGGVAKELGLSTVDFISEAPAFFKGVDILGQHYFGGKEYSPEEIEKAQGELERVTNRSVKSQAEFVSMIPTPMSQISSSIARSVAEAKEEGVPTKVGFVEGTVSGLEKGTFIKMLDVISGRLKTPKKTGLAKEAEKAGISEQDITALNDAIKSGEPMPILKDILDKAKASALSRKAVTPLEEVGKNLKKFTDELKGKVNDTGIKIGEVRSGLGEAGKVSLVEAKDSFTTKLLERLNVGVGTKGVLDFSKSRIKNLSTEKNFIKELWRDLNVKGAVDTRYVDEMASGIGGKLSKGAATKDFSITQGIAQSLKSDLQGLVDDVASANFQALRGEYSALKNLKSTLDKAITKQGTTAPKFLRSTFNATGDIPRDILKQVQDVAEQYGFKNGKNLLNQTDFAIAAERVAKTPGAKQTLGESFAKTLEGRPYKAGLTSGIARGAQRLVAPKPGAMPTFEKFLTKAPFEVAAKPSGLAPLASFAAKGSPTGLAIGKKGFLPSKQSTTPSKGLITKNIGKAIGSGQLSKGTSSIMDIIRKATNR